MTPHTPTPWTVGMYGTSAAFRAIDIHAAVCKPDGSLLATCGPWNDESQMDAAFIVRAVNAHEELLETIRWMAQTVHQGNHLDQPGTFKECPKSVCDAAKQAIEKAEAR